MGAKAGMFVEDIENKRKEEIPFNSKRKTMSVLTKLDGKNYVLKIVDNEVVTLNDVEILKIISTSPFKVSTSLGIVDSQNSEHGPPTILNLFQSELKLYFSFVSKGPTGRASNVNLLPDSTMLIVANL